MKLRLLALLVVLALPLFARQRAVRHPAPAPTFSNEVVRILQQHCQTCHREGDIAPFPLLTYADAKPRAALIDRIARAAPPPQRPRR